METNRSIQMQLNTLFTRLTWPSVLVRERACTAIGELLIYSSHRKTVYQYLLDWLSNQHLESYCMLGILPLIIAKSETEKSFNVNTIWRQLKSPSILAWMLMRELDHNFSIDYVEALRYTSCSLNINRSEFFEKYITYYLPEIYSFWAKEIQKKEHIPFQEWWECEWQEIVTIQKIDLSDNMRYWMGYRRDRYVTADTYLSEVYRSSFLRALARAVDNQNMNIGAAEFLASQACPIDLNLWRLKPLSQPKWWPEIPESDSEFDTSIANIWQQIQKLWENRKNFLGENRILAAASGTIGTHNQDLAYRLEMFGLFQRTHGNKTPDLAELYRVNYLTNMNTANVTWSNYLRFEGVIRPVHLLKCLGELDDWSFISAVHSVGMAPRWQPWRISQAWLPSTCLFNEPLEFTCTNEHVSIIFHDSEISTWVDWTGGITERRHYDLPHRSGQYLVINRDILERFATETNSNFCWLCALTANYKDDRLNDDYQAYTDVKIFGASNIIRPD